MVSTGPAVRLQPIAAIEVTVSFPEAPPLATAHVSAANKARATSPLASPPLSGSPQYPEPIYNVQQMSLSHRGPLPAWLERPLLGAPGALARRLELFADGTTRVTRHKGRDWQDLEPSFVCQEFGDIALSPLGREMMGYIQERAESEHTAARTCQIAAAKTLLHSQRRNVVCGAAAVMVSTALGIAAVVCAASVTLLGGIAIGYVALLLNLWGLDRWTRGYDVPLNDASGDEKSTRLQKEAEAYAQLLRFDDIVHGGAGETYSTLTPAQNAMWDNSLLPHSWFALGLRWAAQLPQAWAMNAASSQGPTAPLLHLAVEEIMAKIARGETRDDEMAGMWEQRKAIYSATATLLDTVSNEPGDSAFERYVMTGAL